MPESAEGGHARHQDPVSNPGDRSVARDSRAGRRGLPVSGPDRRRRCRPSGTRDRSRGFLRRQIASVGLSRARTADRLCRREKRRLDPGERIGIRDRDRGRGVSRRAAAWRTRNHGCPASRSGRPSRPVHPRLAERTRRRRSGWRGRLSVSGGWPFRTEGSSFRTPRKTATSTSAAFTRQSTCLHRMRLPGSGAVSSGTERACSST